MKNFEFSKYCTPAQLYLVIGVICIITGFFANYSIEMLLTKGLFLVVWAWVLNWLCSKGFKAISWIIVLLPFVFFLFMYFLIKDVVVVKEGLINCDGNNWVYYGTQAKCRAAQATEAQVAAAMEAEKKRNEEALAAAKAAADKARADAKAAAEKKRQEEAAAAAAAAAEKKRQEEAAAAAAAAAAEKKRQEEAAAALAKCNGCLAKKTRSQCTPTYCKA
jgi:flagellar biosynthesis GTPase FlhF